jgi:two-component system chemotaxis response regulator CheY
MRRVTAVAKTILIADDSSEIRNELRGLYQAMGFTVVGECENGIKVLDFLSRSTPDVVSLDVIMPEMDGHECLRHIRQRHPAQKVLLVTWLASDPKILAKLQTTIDPSLFVAKPIDRADLAAKLSKLLGVTINTPNAPTSESLSSMDRTLKPVPKGKPEPSGPAVGTMDELELPPD